MRQTRAAKRTGTGVGPQPPRLGTPLYELPIVESALAPVIVLLLTWAAGFTVASGVTVALWTAAVTVVVLEVEAGWRRSRQVPRDL